MTPDIELSELTAGGLNEPNAAWTEAAKTHVTTAIDNALAQRGASLVVHQDVAAEPATAGQIERMLRLHEAVGQSILLQYNPQLALPTKKDDFDWTLGEQISFLKDDSNADYALFVFLRDSFASAGRVGVMIGAAILGIGLPGGVQYGFASLVDLRSGDIVWFNQFGNTTGDLRNGEDAATAITTLLSGLPL